MKRVFTDVLFDIFDLLIKYWYVVLIILCAAAGIIFNSRGGYISIRRRDS
jgi:hypothetical protein